MHRSASRLLAIPSIAMRCPHCATEPLSPEAQFCRKCAAALASRPHKVVRAVRLLVLPLALVGRALSYPIRLRRERTRWLIEASGPASPINDIPGLSDGASAYMPTWRASLCVSGRPTPKSAPSRVLPACRKTVHGRQSENLSAATSYRTGAGYVARTRRALLLRQAVKRER